MNPVDLLILFPPGARGDFLATVLLDSYQKQLATEYQVPHTLCPVYVKLHGLDGDRYSLENCLNVLCTVRIRLSTVQDFLTVAWYWKSKNLSWTPTDTEIITTLLTYEFKHRNLDSRFKHIVDFHDLQNADEINKVYHRIRGHQLAPSVIHLIKENLSLHVNVDTSNYTKYLEGIDIDFLQQATLDLRTNFHTV